MGLVLLGTKVKVVDYEEEKKTTHAWVFIVVFSEELVCRYCYLFVAKGSKLLATNFSFVTNELGFVKIFRDEIHISPLKHTFSDKL